jgi:hypothetical protein
MISVVLLQNGMDVLEHETCSYSETGVTYNEDGSEEVSVKVEAAIDGENECPEAPPVNTEQEVRLRWWQFLSHLWPQKGNCEITRNYFLLCVVLWVPYPF